MNFKFDRKKVTGTLVVVPANEKSFVEEMKNYNFPEARSLKLKEVMGYNKRRMVAGDGGVILMTASTNGLTGHEYYADYNASKAGVILLARTMALELAPKVRVNAVCPGYVLTAMQKAEYTPEMLEHVNAAIPLGRHAKPEELAALYAFLASEEGAYFTGAVISCRVGLCKPEPAIYAHLLERYALASSETVFIDDLDVNLAAAATFGIKTIKFADPAQCARALQALGVEGT